MSETTENTAQSKEVANDGGNGHVPGELQNIQTSYRLNVKNYLKWSQMVRTFLKGKGKLSHLLGTGPQEGDLKFEAWDEKDFMIMSWLWNSMTPEISETCMFLFSAKDIWEATRQTYSKVKDAAQVYEIKTKTSSVRQGLGREEEEAAFRRGNEPHDRKHSATWVAIGARATQVAVLTGRS
ncbi:hypothetical protein ACOSQ3_004177 [Xanthoceras sorbifolium]